MSDLTSELAEIDRLQADYIHALDNQNLTRWLELFSKAPESSYICTTKEHVKNDLPLALMLDDCYARLQDRVTYITKIWAGTFQNYQTRHLMQRLAANRSGDDMIEVISSFVVYATAEENGVAELLTTGEYHDIVKRDPNGYRFAHKKAVLDTSVLPRYIVYPL